MENEYSDKEFNELLIDLLGLRTWYDKPILKTLQANEYLDINPNDDKYRGKINVISAPLNTGKTHFTSLIREDTIFYVNPRRDVIKQYISDYPDLNLFYYEKSDAKPHTTEKLLEARSLAICNLSLNRIGSDKRMKTYGHTPFDEWELDMTTSIGNDARNRQGDEDVRRTLIEESGTVWIIGWLFKDNTFEYLEQFDKDINFLKYHKDIATDIELNLYTDEQNLIGSIMESLSQSKRVHLFTEKKNDLKAFMEKKVAPNIDASWDYFDKKKRPTEDECKTFSDKESQSKYDLTAWTPIASHGYNLRNEAEITTLLFNNPGKSLGGSDIVQFAFRNRDMKTINAFIKQDEVKKISELEQLRISPPQATSEECKLFGTWNRLTKRYEIDFGDVLTTRYISGKKTTLVEKSLRESVFLLQLRWLGMKDKNIHFIDPIEDLQLERVRSNPEIIIAEGRLLEDWEYKDGTFQERAYTDIAKDLDVEKLTLKHIQFHDRGKWKENELRRQQMSDNYFVKTAQAKASGYLQNKTKWNWYQFMAKEFIEKNEQIITQNDFKTSDFWQGMVKHQSKVNYVMKNNGTPNLCITPDDKANPLNWLKRYLTAHNYDCEIYRPSKERKQELRGRAEKSMKDEYKKWKEGQKELAKEGKETFRGLTNQRIEHYLAYVLEKGTTEEKKSLTNDIQELRLIYDTYNMSIKDYTI